MQKKTIIAVFVLMFIIHHTYSQVGINIEQPMGVFHIDGKQDTSTNDNGIINDSDDFIVTNSGNVGIGTANPTKKLSIVGRGENTGIQIKTNASHGKMLAADDNGYAKWISSSNTLITYLQGEGGQIRVDTTAERYVPLNKLKLVRDQIKEVYQGNYGWNETTKQFRVPANGIYRIVINAYFNTVAVGRNPRIYVYQNGVKNDGCGLISINDSGGDTTSYTMTIIELNKDDVLSFYIGANNFRGSNAVLYYASPGHTYAYIEAL